MPSKSVPIASTTSASSQSAPTSGACTGPGRARVVRASAPRDMYVVITGAASRSARRPPPRPPPNAARRHRPRQRPPARKQSAGSPSSVGRHGSGSGGAGGAGGRRSRRRSRWARRGTPGRLGGVSAAERPRDGVPRSPALVKRSSPWSPARTSPAGPTSRAARRETRRGAARGRDVGGDHEHRRPEAIASPRRRACWPRPGPVVDERHAERPLARA